MDQNTHSRLSLVLGGNRSGKSRRGEEIALATGLPVAYVATCPRDLDEEMSERIERHRRERAPGIRTIENQVDLAAIAAANPGHCLLLDCLTLWLYIQTSKYSNHDEILAELGQAMEASLGRVQWVIVSSEIGLGIVPADAESRRFRDLSGSAHQLLGRLADRVELMVAGIPLRVK